MFEITPRSEIAELYGSFILEFLMSYDSIFHSSNTILGLIIGASQTNSQYISVYYHLFARRGSYAKLTQHTSDRAKSRIEAYSL